MATENEKHLQESTERFQEKFLRGVKEHGGNLWKKKVIDQIEDEAMDTMHYVQALKVQHSSIRTIATRGKGYTDIKKIHDCFQSIINMIDTGNSEGEEYGD